MAVPRVTGPTVGSQGPAGDYIRVQADPNTFGAGVGKALGEVAQGLGEAGNAMAEVQQLQRQITQKNQVFEQGQWLDGQVRDKLYNPQTGLFTKKGGAALGAKAEFDGWFKGIKDKALSGVTDPAMQRQITQLFGQAESEAGGRVQTYELGQSENYKAEVQKGALFGAMQDAYNAYDDPKAVDTAIQKVRETIAVNTAGLPPEATKNSEVEAISGIRMAVLQRMVSEDPLSAKTYYDAHREEFSGKDHITARQLLDPAITYQKAKQNVANITRVGAGARDLYTQQAELLAPSMIQQESGGDHTQVSPAGAAGILQVMPDTAREIAAERGDRYVQGLTNDEITNLLRTDKQFGLVYGQHYMAKQLRRYGGDAAAALVAYNAGPGVADKWLRRGRDDSVLPAETRNYYREVLGRRPDGASAAPGARMTRENWTLKNFTPDDLTAPTGGGAWVDAGAAQALDGVAGQFLAATGLKVRVNEERSDAGITAGRRRGTADPADNPHVSKSQHLHGRAFDVQVQGWSDQQKAQFLQLARAAGFGGIGFYGPNGHLHIDAGPSRTWGKLPKWARAAMNTPVGSVPSAGASPGQASPQAVDLVTGPGQGVAPPSLGPIIPDSDPQSALAQWTDAVNNIVDPGERALTQNLLNDQIAQLTREQKAQKEALQQQAFGFVLQGGDPSELPIQTQMKLGREGMEGLYSYRKHRAEGGATTDRAALQELFLMPNEQLAQVDLYSNYRNKLDDNDFDKVLTMQRAARKTDATDADKNAAAGLRTNAQILEQSVDAMGLTGGKKAQMVGTLGPLLDQRISAAQAAGEKLGPVQVQQLLDALTVEGAVTAGKGGIFERRSSSNVRDVGREDLSNFGVETWDEVAPTQQSEVVQRFQEIYGTQPDAPRALDIYNRALRMVNGGEPDGWYGDAVEQARVRALAARARGYPSPEAVPQQIMDDFYGRWLSQFLGL